MPYRKTIFADNQIYHMVNRGVNQAPIFLNRTDYERFINLISFLRYCPNIQYSHFSRMKIAERADFLDALQKNGKPAVEILAFCLMPNHYHILLKQLREKGPQEFMRNLQNSYAKYFNAKNKRSGPLFQSAFCSVRIENDEQLKHVSRYIHLNPSSSYLVKISDLEGYRYSSLNDYWGADSFDFVDTADVLKNFKSKQQYKDFVYGYANRQRELNLIKHLVLEDI